MSIKTLAAYIVGISLCGAACKGRGESKPHDTDSAETSGALYVPDTCAATGAPFSAESPATGPLDSLVGGIPHNRMVKGRKHGIWIEVDSMSGNTSIVRYDRGRIDGQYLWYATLNPHDFGIANALLMFYEKDMANLLSLDKDRNVLRGISDSIKRNVDFVKEAREFGFTGVGRQSVTYGFDDYGNLTDIEHSIYNPERGDDFIVDPFDVGDVQSFKHPEEDELWRDIRKKVERGELKRGGCEWTRKLVGERIPHNYYVGGKKHGLWVERDSGAITVSKYDRGSVRGQRIVYHTPSMDRIACSPYEIGLYEGDRPWLVHVYVKHNIVRSVFKGFGDNTRFPQQAANLGFKNGGMQFYAVEFDSLGNKTYEGWRIFDYYGGKDFRTQSVRAAAE